MTVYKGYMKIIKQNKGMILLYLIIFFGITAIFQAAAKKENYSSYQAESVKIALVDADGGPMAEGLKNYLENFHEVTMMEDTPEVLQENLFYRNVEYIIRIPEDFFERCVVNDEKVPVTKVPGSYTSFYVDQQMNSFIHNVRTYYAAGFSEEEAAAAGSEYKPARVTMENLSGTAGKMPDYGFYFRYIPYMFMGSLCYVMGNVLSAFRRGDLQKRMRASAISGRRQNLEGLLASATVGAGLWIVTIVAGDGALPRCVYPEQRIYLLSAQCPYDASGRPRAVLSDRHCGKGHKYAERYRERSFSGNEFSVRRFCTSGIHESECP